MYINKNIAISESGFMFNPATGDSFSVNPVGQEIIKMLQANASLDEIINKMLEKYSIDRQSLEKDLGDFLYILKSYKILEGDEQA